MPGARNKRADVMLSAVGILAAVAALAMLPSRLMSDSSRAPSGAGQGSVRGYACAAPAEVADEYCRRVARDWSRRAELTTLDRNQASGTARVVDAAVLGAGRRLTAEEIRSALVAAGLSDVVVRAARADDPALDDSVVYAVRIDLAASDSDAACLVGHLSASGFGGGPSLVGTLPGGGCLSD